MRTTSQAQLTRRALLTAVSLAGLGSLGGCVADPEYPVGPLRLATGNRGGVYFAYGQGIAALVRDRLPGLSPQVIATGASVDNLRMVAAGEVEVGFTLADSAALAVRGEDPFTVALPVVALARLYENYLHLVVPLDSGVASVADLAGHRVSVGAAGSGTEVVTGRLLASAGLAPGRDLLAFRLGVDESAAALADGRLDAFFFSGGIPTTAIARLAARYPVRLLDLSRYVRPLRAAYGEFYAERTVPAAVYRLSGPVATIGVPNYLVVRRDLDERIAYQLTRTLFAGRERLAATHPEGRRLSTASAISTYPLDLHRGAVRYYREAKP
ncbi:MAG TPA: TAXI family TRAP transporter solute-binding subunit [Micromonosporaceae bacterium]